MDESVSRVISDGRVFQRSNKLAPSNGENWMKIENWVTEHQARKKERIREREGQRKREREVELVSRNYFEFVLLILGNGGGNDIFQE